MIKSFILYAYLLTFILSYNPKKVEYKPFGDNSFEGKGSTSFEVKISGDIQTYFHIKVDPTSNSKSNPYIAFSNTDENCRNDRKQLSMNPYLTIDLIIKSSQIKDKNKFYICVVCQKEENCEYSTKFQDEL